MKKKSRWMGRTAAMALSVVLLAAGTFSPGAVSAGAGSRMSGRFGSTAETAAPEEQTSEPRRVQRKEESGETGLCNESSETAGENGETPGTGCAADTGGTADDDDTVGRGGTAENGETEKSGGTAKKGETAESGETAKKRENADSGDTVKKGETAESGETAKKRENAESGETAKSEETSETAEKKDTGTATAPGETASGSDRAESRQAGESMTARDSGGAGYTDLPDGDSVRMKARLNPLRAKGRDVDVVIRKVRRFEYKDYGFGSEWGTTMYRVAFRDDEGNKISAYATCIQPSKAYPDDNTEAKLSEISGGRLLAKVMYYGMRSLSKTDSYWDQQMPEESLGTRWITTHVAASKVAGTADWDYKLNPYGKDMAQRLINFAKSQSELPDPEVHLNGQEELYVDAVNDGGSQRTPDITFNAAESNTITLTLPKDVRIFRYGKGKFSAPSDGTLQVTLNGGEKFYLEAPIDEAGTLNAGSSYLTARGTVRKDLRAYRLVVNNKDDQNLALVFGVPAEGIPTRVKLHVRWLPRPTVQVVKKVSGASGDYAAMVQGNPLYSLKGSVYGLYETQDAAAAAGGSPVCTLTCGEDGASEPAVISAKYTGQTLYLRELTAGKGYQLDTAVHPVVISEGVNQIHAEDRPLFTDLSLLKEDLDRAGGDADSGLSLADIHFLVSYFSWYIGSGAEAEQLRRDGKATRSWELVTTGAGGKGSLTLDQAHLAGGSPLYLDENGHGVLPLGTVCIRETEPPGETGFTSTGAELWFGGQKTSGYPYSAKIEEAAGDGGTKTVQITGQDGISVSGNAVYTAKNHEKYASLRILKTDQSDQSPLPEAVFCLKDTDDQIVIPTKENGITGSIDDDGLIRTGGDGIAEVRHILCGTYRLEEISAPAHYAAEYGETIQIFGEKQVNVGNRQIRAGVCVRKTDADLGENAQGSAEFAAAEFEITAAERVKIGEEIFEEGDVVICDLVTGEDGTARTEADALAPGSYVLHETEPPEGMLTGEDVPFEISDEDDGKVLELSFADPVARGDVKISKADMENNECHAQGGASLSGCRIAVYNDNEQPVAVDCDGDGTAEKLVPPGEEVISIVTDGNGIAATPEHFLPYGHYRAVETGNPSGYLLPDEETRREAGFDISSDGETADLTEPGSGAADEPVRSDIRFHKMIAETGANFAQIPFRITSLTTGETHIVMTGEDGVYDSRRVKHSSNTNAGDGTNGSETAGLWFGMNAAGGQTPVRDDAGALPFDSYRIEELPCTANRGRVLYTGTFDVKEDDRNAESAGVDLGDITNEKVPGIRTSLAAEDGGKTRLAEKNVTLTDTVSYERLTVGKEYVIRGTLMDKESGQPVKNADGSPVTAQTEFTCRERNGRENVIFRLDASGLAGSTVVAFEELLLGGIPVTAHKDIDDAAQAVTFPKLSTAAALDPASAEGGSDGEIVIRDQVDYAGLVPGQEYRLEGRLMDKETGQQVRAGGQDIKSGAVFRPESSDGSIMILFRFPAKEMAGRSLVAFERLFLADTPIASHENIDSQEQTVLIGTERKTDSKEKETKATDTSRPDRPESDRSSGGSPKTGDSSVTVIWVLLAAAAVVMASILAEGKKNHKNNEKC